MAKVQPSLTEAKAPTQSHPRTHCSRTTKGLGSAGRERLSLLDPVLGHLVRLSEVPWNPATNFTDQHWHYPFFQIKNLHLHLRQVGLLFASPVFGGDRTQFYPVLFPFPFRALGQQESLLHSSAQENHAREAFYLKSSSQRERWLNFNFLGLLASQCMAVARRV